MSWLRWHFSLGRKLTSRPPRKAEVWLEPKTCRQQGFWYLKGRCRQMSKQLRATAESLIVQSWQNPYRFRRLRPSRFEIRLLAARLDHLEEVAPGIGEEGETQSQGGDVVGLADDFHAAALQLVDCIVNAIHTNTQVVPSGEIVAGVEIFVWWAFRGAGARQNFKAEAVVPSGRKNAEGQFADGDGPEQPEVKRVAIPRDRFLKIGHADARMIDFPRRERAGGVGGRRR